MGIIVEIVKAIVYGIVEGITEWLPVSSTGHLILLQDYIKLNASEAFLSMFEVVIQLGAILAVVVIFFSKLWIIKKDTEDGRWVVKLSTIKMWIKIVVACIPAAVVGILYDDKIDELFYKPLPVALALIIVGILFIITEKWIVPKMETDIKNVNKIPLRDALIIGVFQLLAAVFPGTSRSGATIIGGLVLGLSRKTAAEFTFFLAVPVMFGASLLKSVKFLMKGISMTVTEFSILSAGTLTAFFVSLFAINFLMGYIKKHNFVVFGYYRIILGFVIILAQVIDF